MRLPKSPRSLTLVLLSFILQVSVKFTKLIISFVLGLGTLEVQAEDQPLRPHWLHQHCVRFTRWFACCVRWQGRNHHVVGSQRGQALVLS